MITRYQEFQPPARLAPFVECFWAVAPGRPVAEYAVLPDGCVDIVYSPGNSSELQLVGAMTHARRFNLSGQLEFGLRFRPGMSQAFLPLPGPETTDQAIALSGLWGDGARRLADQMAEAGSPAQSIAILAALLREPRQTSVVQRLSAVISQHGGQVPLDHLALQAGLSARQMRRLFQQQLGLSPKLFSRVLRFRHSLAQLSRGPSAGWAQVALQCGYYDQAHFINEFREFSGYTPVKFMALER